MDFEKELEIIKKLRSDEHYFGEFGRQFLSNSDINVLIKKPEMYGEPFKSNADFLKGKYLHYRILQPELVDPMIVVDANTRNNKEYKEIVEKHWVEGQEKPIFLLKKEVEALEPIVKAVERNDYFMEMLRGDRSKDGFDVEEPSISELEGYIFKGKADRVNHNKQIVCDFKTTRNIDTFVESFSKYGYDSQAYIYRELFGYDVKFFVVDKETGRLGVFDVSDVSYDAGREKVKRGIERYEMYYGDEPSEDINQFYLYDLI